MDPAVAHVLTARRKRRDTASNKWIIAAADKGSVIAKDKAVAILIKLAAAGHGAKALPILLERLEGAAPNQFPMYAEQALPVMDVAHRAAFVRLLEAWLGGIEASAKRTPWFRSRGVLHQTRILKPLETRSTHEKNHSVLVHIHSGRLDLGLGG